MVTYIPYLGGPRGLLLKLPIMAISSVWHRLSPFQRLKMIPGSVSISSVRRVVLAGQSYLAVVSDVSNLISCDLPILGSPTRLRLIGQSVVAKLDFTPDGRFRVLLASTKPGEHT